MYRNGNVRRYFNEHLRKGRSRLVFVAVVTAIFVGAVFVRSSLQRSTPTLSTEKDFADLTHWTSCRGHGPPEWKQHRVSDVRIGSKTWRLATHRSGDIVSNSVNSGTLWEQKVVEQLIRDLRILSPANGNNNKPAVFIDVGANIGWFSFIAANYGHKVYAFEPFKENLQRFNHSLCLNTVDVRKKIKIFPFALGSRDGITCEQWSEPTNHGDAIAVCDSKESARVKKRLDISGYDYLGKIEMKTMDKVEELFDSERGILEGANVVMKIDTEGFEAAVVGGARRLFQDAKTRPKVVYSEFCKELIQKAGLSMGMSRDEAMLLPDAYLRDMKAMGYEVDPVPLNDTSVTQDITFRLPSTSR